MVRREEEEEEEEDDGRKIPEPRGSGPAAGGKVERLPWPG
jgi:hypothetical protein